MKAKKDPQHEFVGTWHIDEMELWDEDYINMEAQAYIEVDAQNMGHFQFGLVSGQMDGEIVEEGERRRLEFTWDGNDECDEAQGSGWLELTDENHLEGRIKFHHGDSSTFTAERAKS